MVYTVTFNPSIDYIVTVDDFRTGMTNRTTGERMLCGGKGINVSMVLKNMGIENTALGFIAGFTGDEIDRLARNLGVHTDFIRAQEGISRINVKLTSIDGTEINGMGPVISDDLLRQLMDRLDTLSEGDVLVLAGSIPGSMPADIYSRIMKRLQGRNILIVVDAAGTLLTNVLPYHPFLIKPNRQELEEIYHVTITGRRDVVEYARRLQQAGAANVLVSMGSQGGVLVSANGQVFEAEAPKGTLRNSVGSGDSMVAGFLTGWLGSHSYEEAFRWGIACGSASAFSDNLTTAGEAEAVYRQVIPRRISGASTI